MDWGVQKEGNLEIPLEQRIRDDRRKDELII
jgi:hypothetical protein